MEIEAFEEADLEGLDRFAIAEWGDLVLPQRRHLEDPQCHPWKVVLDGETVGIGTATDLGKTGWLSFVAVRQDHRRRGIGGRLVEHLIRFLAVERGCKTVSLVTTELGRGVYERAGFRFQTEYVSLASDRLHPREPPYSDEIVPCAEEHMEALLSLDLEICGEDRSPVLRRLRSSSFAYLSGSRVEGLLFPSLGEGVIEADSPRAGLELARFKAMVSPVALVPAENRLCREYLRAQGFREGGRRTRMVLGEALRWRPEAIFGL